LDTKAAYQLAKDLRKRQTAEEFILWQHLRKRSFIGLKFYRQHVLRYNAGRLGVKFFVADFYCPEIHLVIELDGEIHDYQKSYDNDRDEILKTKEITTLRISNKEFLDLASVLRKISNKCLSIMK